MGSDAIANARISAFARDSAKKKKGSRFGKVKQNKVDVRREQWVSQVKNKGCKMESDALASAISKPMDGCRTQANFPTRAREGDEHEPTSLSWASKKDFTGRISRRTYSSSFSSNEEDRGYNEGGLDNWEAVADALPSSNDSNKYTLESDFEPLTCSSDHRCSRSVPLEDTGRSRGHQGNNRAWAPDYTFRPQTLPRVSAKHQKQKKNFQMQNSDGWRSTRLPCQQTVVSEEPSACPICCEVLDVTDSSFLPCPCGFRLCLFCHKRILEVDARCPGCRKQYDDFVHAGAGFNSEPVVAY